MRKHQRELSKNKGDKMQETFWSIFDGLIISDAFMYIPKRCINARYGQNGKQLIYSIYLKNLLLETEAGCSITQPSMCIDKFGVITFHLKSRIHPVFTPHYARWYTNKKKHVPKDIVLTPDVVRHWFIGDGNLHWNKERFRGICLATHSFSNEDREFLQHLMKEIGINIYIFSAGQMYIPRKSVENFFSYVQKCPVSCYDYKWEFSSRSKYNELKDVSDCITIDNQQRSTWIHKDCVNVQRSSRKGGRRQVTPKQETTIYIVDDMILSLQKV